MRWEYLSGILKVISKLCFVKDKTETFEEKIFQMSKLELSPM